MPAAPETVPRVEALGAHHDRASFSSGIEALDKYLWTQAAQEARKNISAPFLLVLSDGSIGGYYTLSSTAVKLSELPAPWARRLPRYPLIPATLLGRLAVDLRQRGKGYGRFLLADALLRAIRSEIASFAVLVDAKDEATRRFCERVSDNSAAAIGSFLSCRAV